MIKFLRDEIYDNIVPIFSAQAMIAVGRYHLDLVIDDAHDRDVERAAAEIENEHSLIFIELIEPIGQRRGRRLVDDLKNVEPGELTGRDRSGALGIIEVGRDRD